jgi:hypothetical protein
VIRYSPPHEAEIALDHATAGELADLIARGEGAMAGDATADPKPYQRLLDAVRVSAASSTDAGKVVLALDADADADARVLTITGAFEHLAVLADVVRDLAADPDPHTHVHIEYFDGHYYLAYSEVALVLRITA